MTRAQRHERYKLAYRKILRRQEWFLCWALSVQAHTIANLKSYPEVLALKPKIMPSNKGDIWFLCDEDGRASRLRILRVAINQTSHGKTKK